MRTRKTVCTIGLILVAASFSVASKADNTVELKTGQRIDGTLKSVTQTTVELDVAGQSLALPRARVSAIYFETPPKTSCPAHGASGNLVDALRVIKGLQSATSVGITYRDYAPRVVDAKIKVDQLLSTVPKGRARALLTEALGFYIYASNAWNAKISQDDYQSLALNPLFQRCVPLKQLVKQLGSQSPDFGVKMDADTNRGIAIAVGGETALFECASQRIEESERLLRN